MSQRNDTWFERNVVHPMAYGGDQAVNDWLGERGLAKVEYGVIYPIAVVVGLFIIANAVGLLSR